MILILDDLIHVSIPIACCPCIKKGPLIYYVVSGGLSEWTLWSSCDNAGCGHQQERRQRYCNNPKPQSAGATCGGIHEEDTTCSVYEYKRCGGET